MQKCTIASDETSLKNKTNDFKAFLPELPKKSYRRTKIPFYINKTNLIFKKISGGFKLYFSQSFFFLITIPIFFFKFIFMRKVEIRMTDKLFSENFIKRF